MIIGYQIEDKHGRNWHDNIDRADNPCTVLSEQSVIKELKILQKTRPERDFRMIAVLEGDIEYPFFEWSLTAANDQYKTLGVSICHIPLDEHEALNELSYAPDCNMIMGRNTGWLIKLYDEPENNLGYNGMGEEFHNILVSAVKAGYRMIEIDADAQVHDQFPIF
ncbi:TPA: hypothetical protein I7297_15270 [Vibrio parahaemolyticus]|nr:hypothetical protein [Vibrio parahaemolyticus]